MENTGPGAGQSKLNITMPNTGIMMQEVEKAMFDSKISKKFDNYLGRIGIQESMWWKISFYSLIIYMLLTCLVMFYRTDFINLSYSVGAFYTIVFGEYKKKSVYTALIYSSIGIIVFDIVWLILFAGVGVRCKIGLEWRYSFGWRWD